VTLRPRTLRARLALIFAVVTIAVSTSVAAFVLLRYRSDLTRQINENLEARLSDVRGTLRGAHLLPKPERVNHPVIPRAESFAQVLTPAGGVYEATPRALKDNPVLGPKERARAALHTITLDRPVLPGAGDARLLAGPATIGKTPVIVVVGASLAEHERSQNQLAHTLAIALPVLAAVVIVAAWFIVGAALRPMRALVSEADELSIRRRGRLSQQGPAEVADLARHLNDMLARIEAALEHERAFLDDASHELRTPIAIARGELELARPLAADNEAVGAAVDSALEEIERLEKLARNLLVLARTRAAGPPAEIQVDLRTACERAVDNVRRARTAATVAIDVVGDASTVGDAEALERALGNLVENAVRHARSHVMVTIGHPNGEAVVEVADDGPGFPVSVVARTGERFVRGADGVGLGLAIAEAIASAHGGNLSLSNLDNGATGAVARLELPLMS
jgi:signal transduction histidine kinase